MRVSDEATDSVYAELADDSGEPPPSEAFEVALRKRLVSEYLAGEIDIEELSAQIGEIHDTLSKSRQVRAEGRTAKPHRQDYRRDAIAKIFAIEAGEATDVARFRDEVLEGQFIVPDQVASWIRHHSETDGKATVFVKLPLDESGQPLPMAEAMTRGEYEISKEILRYAVEGDEALHVVPIRTKGVLHRLKAVSDRLVGRYGWAPPWAVDFVLTGRTPPLTRATVKQSDTWPWWNARRTVSISDVPLWIRPAEVMEMFRHARNEMLNGKAKPRSLSRERSELGLFAFQHRRGMTWSETMDVWNRHHPDSTYDSDARFIRDCRDAFLRITGTSLDWIGKDDTREEKSK